MSDRHSKAHGRTRWIAWACPLIMGPALLGAQDVTLQSAGGTGGDPYTIGCGSKAMVGIQGRAGSTPIGDGVVRVIQALCVDLNADGTWIGAPAPGLGAAGVNSASDLFVAVTCPHDQAVSGINGRVAGGYVNTVAISCAALGQHGQLHGPSTAVASELAEYSGLLGDSPFGTFLCPDSKPGKGFTGRAHDWVDQIALICSYPTVAPAAVKSIASSSTSIVGGSPLNGTVTLNAPAPPSGTPVSLSVNNASLGTFQTNPITVAAGQSTASFVLNTSGVVLASSAVVTASPNVGAPSVAVTVQPPALKAVSLPSNIAIPGIGLTGTVELTGAAFRGGLALELTSGNAGVASVPATISVPEGQTSATFPVTTGSFSMATGSTRTGCTYITATYNGVQRTARLAVIPKGIGAFNLSGANGSTTVTVTFPTTSTTARTLSLASSNTSLIQVPSSVLVTGKAASASFTMNISGAAAGSACVVITATDGTGGASSLVVALSSGMVIAVSGS